MILLVITNYLPIEQAFTSDDFLDPTTKDLTVDEYIDESVEDYEGDYSFWDKIKYSFLKADQYIFEEDNIIFDNIPGGTGVKSILKLMFFRYEGTVPDIIGLLLNIMSILSIVSVVDIVGKYFG